MEIAATFADREARSTIILNAARILDPKLGREFDGTMNEAADAMEAWAGLEISLRKSNDLYHVMQRQLVSSQADRVAEMYAVALVRAVEWRAAVVEVLCSQALADDLGDVRDAEGRLWKLLGIEEPVPEHDSAWLNTQDTLRTAGVPLPQHLADDEEDEG